MGHFILEYYRYIDDNAFDDLVKVFAEDIVYNRCGKEIKGLDRLLQFYKNSRKLSGTHQVIERFQCGDRYIVKGKFTGHNGKGEPLDIRFVDIFAVNAEGLIFERETYLALGFDLLV